MLNVTANYDLGKKNPNLDKVRDSSWPVRDANDLKEFAPTTLQDEILVSKLSSVGQCFEDFKLLDLKQSTITDFFSSWADAPWLLEAINLKFPFSDSVPRKTLLSHKVVMFLFAECTVHRLDSS